MATEWKPGDRAQLVSGGPVMTVKKVETQDGEELVVCRWFVRDEKVEECSFTPDELIEPPDELIEPAT